MNSPNQQQGLSYELRARQFLEQEGLEFIASNLSFKVGELDLVMFEPATHTYVIVEVKQRTSKEFGGAIQSLSKAKIRRITRSTELFFKTQGLNIFDQSIRVDFIAIDAEVLSWVKNITMA